MESRMETPDEAALALTGLAEAPGLASELPAIGTPSLATKTAGMTAGGLEVYSDATYKFEYRKFLLIYM
jgi:hypothetical protein